MTDAPTCARCGREMRHDVAVVCGRCGSYLRADLSRAGGLEGDVQVTIARQDRVARGPSKPDTDPWESHGMALEAVPLPVNLDAAEAYEAARGELTTWARHCCEERGIDYADGGLQALCSFLAGQVDWLRYRQEADEAFGAVEDACKAIRRLVDTRLPGEIVGLCSCGTARYSTHPEKCQRCGNEELEFNRADLDASVGAYEIPASLAARWVADMGLVTDSGKLRKLIWAWANRGHLRAVCGHETCMTAWRGEMQGPACEPVAEPPAYRFGDILERVMLSPALRAA